MGDGRPGGRHMEPAIDLTSRATTRLRLRRITAGDLPTLIAIHTDPATNFYRPGGPPTPEWSRQMVEALIAAWDDQGIGYWSIEFEGQLIGVAGIEPLEFEGRSCWNLYYRLTPTAWGKGLASEAAREAVEVAAAVHADWPVVARTRPENLPSARVAEGAGLERRPDLDGGGFIVFARGW
jgi:[ribosomal protein S5]-alanine N-acetyltransferase